MREVLDALIQKIVEFATAAGIRIIGAIVVLLVGARLVRWVLRRVQRGKRFEQLTSNSKVLIIDILKVVLYVLLIAVVASTLGIETTSITAAIASAGLAIGLALQGSLSNFAGGMMILAFKQFAIGDFIDNGEHSGTVKDIGIFYTTLETPDNKVITIPNGVLSNQPVVDFSARKTRRVDFEFNLSYSSDIELVKRTLFELAEHELVLDEPSPFVALAEQGESALVFYLRVWVKSSDYWTVRFDIMEKSKIMFDKRGISIPYPQIDVHIDSQNRTAPPN